MIKVSNKAMEALFSEARFIKYKALLYIDNAIIDITDDIIAIDTIDETSKLDSDAPFGYVTGNQVTLTLNNIDKKYITTNKDSILYGKLIKGIKMKLLFSIETELDIFEDIDMGFYFLFNIDSKNESGSATIIFKDGLGIELGNIVKPFRSLKNATIDKCLKSILPDSTIVVNDIKMKIPLFYKNGSTIGDNLTNIATAFMCNIYADKQGRIVASALEHTSNTPLELTDSNFIITSGTAPSYNTTFSDITIKYSEPVGMKREHVFNSDAEYGIGDTVVNTTLDKHPVIDISSIISRSLQNTMCEVIDYDSDIVNFKVTNNTDTKQRVIIDVYGMTVESTNKELNRNNNTVSTGRYFELSFPYFVDASYIAYYADRLISIYGSDIPVLKILLKGLPILELGDNIRINSDTSVVNNVYTIDAIKHTFEDGLMTEITVIPNSRYNKNMYVFVFGGMIIKNDA